MKNLISFFAVFIFLQAAVFAQGSQIPAWQWVNSAGGIADEIGRMVASDNNGNVYVTGYFYNLPISFGSFNLTNSGQYDLFVVKYNSNGNVIWAKSFGGNNNDISEGISLDSNGNAIITGSFMSGSITFGSITLYNVNAGYEDFFTMKLDSLGNVQWAKSAGGMGLDLGSALTIDASNNILVTGSFSSASITFDSILLGNTTGNRDIFVVKYDSNGNVIWAKKAGGSNADYSTGITVDASENVIITGTFSGSSIIFGATTLFNSNFWESDIFIVKYDANGNILWAKSEGGYIDDFSTGIATDESGNIYLTGSFNSNSITFGNTSLIKNGINNIFITKYDSNGNSLWAKSAVGNHDAAPSSIAIDENGSAIITGGFLSSTINFGTTTLNCVGGEDIFAVNYNSDGNVLWAKSAGGTSYDRGLGICSDVNLNIFVTGRFSSSSILFNSSNILNAGSNDFFIAKIGGVTSIDENDLSPSISIYPNPFSIQTNLSANMSFKNKRFRLYNSLGVEVTPLNIFNNFSDESVSLNRDNLTNGIYFIQIIEDYKIECTKKLIVID